MIKFALQNKLIELRRSNKGVALVELSLLLPMVILLVGGTVELSRAFYQFQIADKGVKSAARYLARIPGNQVCPPASAAWTAGQVAAKNLAQRGSLSAGDPFTLSNWQNANDVTIAVSCVDNSTGGYVGGDSIPVVNVSTSFTFDDLGFLGIVKLNNINITTSHQEVYIGG